MKRISALILGALLLAGGPARAQTAAPAAAAPDPPAGFFAANAKAPGVKVLPSGLQYKVLQSGPAGGPSPKAGDVIKVDYEGTLLSGEVFDSSIKRGKPALLQLQNLVPGWMQAIPMMHVGDEWMLYVPSYLGYGDEGDGPIPPGSALIFRIKLLGMLSAD